MEGTQDSIKNGLIFSFLEKQIISSELLLFINRIAYGSSFSLLFLLIRQQSKKDSPFLQQLRVG